MDESEEEHIIGNYYVGWADMESNRTICFRKDPEGQTSRTIISGYIFAVGNDSSYIIAKSHPGVTTDITYYHIVDVREEKLTNFHTDNCWTTESKKKFNLKRSELGILNLEFDKNYTENPW
ncbi:MAG: DUF3997 domain-containing protein [Crocinitomicaceae bacterium]